MDELEFHEPARFGVGGGLRNPVSRPLSDDPPETHLSVASDVGPDLERSPPSKIFWIADSSGIVINPYIVDNKR